MTISLPKHDLGDRLRAVMTLMQISAFVVGVLLTTSSVRANESRADAITDSKRIVREPAAPIKLSTGSATSTSSPPNSGDRNDFINQACNQSEAILIAEYIGIENAGSISILHPPLGKFRVDTTLKGPKMDATILVVLENENRAADGSASVRAIPESSLPNKGEQYFLFLTKARPETGIFKTFEGSSGRILFGIGDMATIDNALKSTSKDENPKDKKKKKKQQ